MPGEFDLISQYFAPLCGENALGLKDDAAVFGTKPGLDNVITKDLIVEGTHFRPQDDVAAVGFKALAVNVSDCIAKGATPALYWVGLALPHGTPHTWFRDFATGLQEAQEQFNCTLAGGDTTSHSGHYAVISVTLLGHVPSGRMVRRSGAKVDDDLYITGTLGDAALGLRALNDNIAGFEALKARYIRPAPPFGINELLLDVAHAAADVSDGLIADVGHICAASSVGGMIYADKIPRSKSANAFLEAHSACAPLIWSGGDDYQTVFTAHKDLRSKIAGISADFHIPVSRIGYITDDTSIHLLDLNEEKMHLAEVGYQHF